VTEVISVSDNVMVNVIFAVVISVAVSAGILLYSYISVSIKGTLPRPRNFFVIGSYGQN
jgi:hypothetical protein